MFLLLKELSPPDGLPARTHPLGRGVFNETPSPKHYSKIICHFKDEDLKLCLCNICRWKFEG